MVVLGRGRDPDVSPMDICDVCTADNFKRSFDKILRKAGVKTGTFHDIRRTAITMWLANGMSEYDVMVLTGHSSFTTTHKFYLAVSNDLVHRARVATVQGIRQKLVRFSTRPIEEVA
jgi:integrase